MRRTDRIAAVLLAGSCTALAAEAPRTSDLTDLSLEQLANIEVTSVSRHAERLVDAPASIFVITGEDIRRSGARTLPEALRLAPNLQVARSSASTYAISARGFAADSVIGNKLLVLIDGRTVYSPLFSNVFWDQQDVMLEDVERIEVISGPGATLWGANAVNGVINVVTRPARDTQGALLVAGAGNVDSGYAFRYGGRIGEDGTVRVYGKSLNVRNTRRASGVGLPDSRDLGQVGFRTDWGGAHESWTLQGDAYQGETEDRPAGGGVKVSGMNLLARWSRQLDSGADLKLQTYYDRARREDRTGFQGDVDTYDVEFHHGIPFESHRVFWGAGYRYSRDDIPDTLGPLVIRFIPQSRALNRKNVFVQDEIALSKQVELTVGIKLESNDYTGWEYLPSARIAWKPATDRLVWGAVSRAVRAPARLDRDFFLVFTPLNLALIKGGPYFEAEVATVFELGYREQPSSRLSYSITAFHHSYDKLRSGQVAPAFIQNRIEGPINGFEGWGAFQATDAWRLSGGFTTLHKHLGLEAGSNDPQGATALGNDPTFQWQLRSSWNFAPRHEFDVMVRRGGALPNPIVPAYTAVDARLGWRPSRDIEVSLTVQNLFDSSHPEFNTAPGRSEFERAAFLSVKWRM